MDEKELRNRIKNADSQKDTPALSEAVVAAAPLSAKSRFPNFRLARLAVAGAAAVALAIGITLPGALRPEPLFVLAGSGGAENMAMATSADASTDAKSMIWPGWIEYNYIAQGLSDERGSGEIFEVRRVGDPVELLQRVAAAFSVSGEVKEDDWSTPEFPSYSITGEDFSVNVWWSGPGGWYFSRWSNDWIGCVDEGFDPEAEPEESEKERGCLSEPYEPTPELIPSESEMLSQATEIFGALGMEVDSNLARVWRDDWGGSVSVPLTLNGSSIPLEAYVGWDGKGRLSYASGYSIEIVSRGNFDTISPLAAVDRISDWRWFGGVASHYYEEMYPIGIARSDAAVSEPAPADSSMSSDSIAADEPMPLPEEYPTEPEVIDVVIDRSVTALLSVYDAAGNMWLVPGYLLYNDQGWFDAIIAVEEGVIALPEPIEMMPLIEDAPVETQVEPRG